MKIAVAQLNPIIGDLEGNSKKIIEAIQKAKKVGAQLILFSEMVLTGYPPEDFLLLPHFISAVEKKLEKIISSTEGIYAIVGLPRKTDLPTEKPLFNSAAIIHNQKILGFQNKILLPTYDVFDERRYFEPGNEIKTWNIEGKKVAITICEDIWQLANLDSRLNYYRDPIKEVKKEQPDLLLNLSASPYSMHKFSRRLEVCKCSASYLQCPIILCNQVGGNDSLLFDGCSIYIEPNHSFQCAKAFSEDLMLVELGRTFTTSLHRESMEDLYQALVMGIRDYFQKLGFKKACLGLSGGIDSALVACLGVEALGRENLIALSMPSRYSSQDCRQDAKILADRLGIEFKEISIEPPFECYLDLLEPQFEGKPRDTTEENIQARIRGMILMALSNKLGAIVLNAGNKSELAAGYATLYGDMCGGLAVIGDVSKQQVYALARWINRHQELIPLTILDREPSAELKPNQKDTDSLPSYDIVDSILQAYIEEHRSPEEIVQQYGYSHEIVEDLILRIHRNEYKRRQGAPVLRVTEKAFSAGRRFPIVQRWI